MSPTVIPNRVIKLATQAFVALGVVAGAALGATPAAATASDAGALALADKATRLLYSIDGEEYSSTVPDIFENSPKLVPGESVEEQLWVRNHYDIPVDVFIAAPGMSEPANRGPGIVAPSNVISLKSGESGALQVRLTVPASSGNDIQGQRWPVKIQVKVTESSPSTGDVLSGGVRDSQPALGATGATPGLWQLALAVILGGACAYAGARSRSRRVHVVPDRQPSLRPQPEVSIDRGVS